VILLLFEVFSFYTLLQELLQKMSQSHFSWGKFVLPVLTIFAAIVAYDILASPNIKGNNELLHCACYF
jgi:hypothetical protein